MENHLVSSAKRLLEEKAEEPAPIIKEEEPADISEFIYDESEKEEAPEPQESAPAAEAVPAGQQYGCRCYQDSGRLWR